MPIGCLQLIVGCSACQGRRGTIGPIGGVPRSFTELGAGTGGGESIFSANILDRLRPGRLTGAPTVPTTLPEDPGEPGDKGEPTTLPGTKLGALADKGAPGDKGAPVPCSKLGALAAPFVDPPLLLIRSNDDVLMEDCMLSFVGLWKLLRDDAGEFVGIVVELVAL
eukprot:gnl/TRDRNA2_/TRDRNA2_145885_c1_seq1.p2 gnl/TRDRNA2_/TRDRNA2_145885_c1~~gnl/TRDRNA2_/TRDRNA2_145885_c1_seq1.p2  ORF type:complete len:166 (-),score=15.73 gnl/TRDRNA2_/TRDRNA2_145885_c1_seq1:112-609(-)